MGHNTIINDDAYKILLDIVKLEKEYEAAWLPWINFSIYYKIFPDAKSFIQYITSQKNVFAHDSKVMHELAVMLHDKYQQGEEKQIEEISQITKLITKYCPHSIDAVDNNGFKPLDYAVKANSPFAIKMLMNNGASPFQAYHYKWIVKQDAFQYALSQNKGKALDAILKYANKFKSIIQDASAFTKPDDFAFQRKEYLLQNVIQYFMKHKNPELLKILFKNFEHGKFKDVLNTNLFCGHSTPEGKKITALELAIGCNAVKCVKILLKNGADPNLPNPQFENNMPIFWALEETFPPLFHSITSFFSSNKDALDVLELLLKYGADPSAINGQSHKTPLHLAYINCNTHAIRLLEKYGADRDVVDIYGKTPYEYSFEFAINSTIEQLHEAYNEFTDTHKFEDIFGIPLCS